MHACRSTLEDPTTASFAITPQSLGSAVVTPQLLFDSTNWNLAQTVTVRAIDDDVIDGSDALVFPALDGRVNEIRGPLLIDGAIRVSEERFLNNPLLFPGEKNFPNPDGRLTGAGTTTPDGLAFITDVNATHVNARTGERPGFDPRMNDFAFVATLLSGAANEQTLDVLSVSADILSVAKTTAFSVLLTVPANGSAEFIGTPVQTSLSAINWTSAVIKLSGTPKIGETWTLSVDTNGTSANVSGTLQTYAAPITTAAQAVASDIAQRLAAAINASTASPRLSAEVRVGLLGDSRIILKKVDGTVFNTTLTVTPAAGQTTDGGATISGTASGTTMAASIAAANWTMAAVRILTLGNVTQTWKIKLAGTEFPYTIGSNDTIGDVTAALAEAITSDYSPLVSGSQVTLKTPWPTNAAGSPLQAAAGDEYFVKPFNLNFRVNEADQVDTLNLFNNNSPADDYGVLTDGSITGLGMGGDTVVADRLIPGGITYKNLEVVNIALGFGDNHFVVESTHEGATRITSGKGDDVIDVKTIAGHTSVSTGAGDDTLRVSNDETLVDQITGLLTVDMGTGASDHLIVDDSGDVQDDNQLALTGSTLTGLDMPTVPEEQSIFVQAHSGTFRLQTTGFGVETPSLPVSPYVTRGAGFASVLLDYSLPADDTNGDNVVDDSIATRLRALYGFNDLKVSVVRTSIDATFRLTFTGMHAGIDYPELTWPEPHGTASGLVADIGASVDVRIATLHDGALTAPRNEVQTLTVAADGGSYVLHFDVLRDGKLVDVATAPIAWNATAAAVQAALSAVLNPNNTNPALPFTDNVAVSQHGSTYHVEFQGEHRNTTIAFVDARGLRLGTGQGSLTVATRQFGINYYGVDTLDVNLGSDDVVNVQSTSATTNLDLGDGDEAIYISSTASVAMGEHPDFLTGNLNGINGTLNINVGTGHHLLMISDESDTTGDDVLITGSKTAALAHSPSVTGLADGADLYIVGLSVGGISIKADPAAGDFAGGVTIWTGSGADTITVNKTLAHVNAGAPAGTQVLTTLNTGLGNDVVTVNLAAGANGPFVLNTQGAYQQVLHLATDLTGADYNVPAETITVSVNGVPLTTPNAYTVDNSVNTISLTVSPDIGATIGVQIDKTFAQAFAAPASGTVTFTAADIAAASEVTAYVNGVLVPDADVHVNTTADTVSITGASLPPAGALVVVHVRKTITESFRAPQVLDADNDNVDAHTSTLPLVIFGGQGDDVIRGGSGGDIVFGDRGRVLYFDPSQPVPPIGSGVIDATALATLQASAVTVLGHGGPGDKSDAIARRVSLVISVDGIVGGTDSITTGVGSDIIVGGLDDDTIVANALETTATPDGNNIVLGDLGFVDFATQDGDPSTLDRVWSLDTDLGGSDHITTGAGNDIVIGGEDGEQVGYANLGAGVIPVTLAADTVNDDGDVITAGAGRNLVFGDNGRITAAATSLATAAVYGGASLTLGRMEGIDSLIGGSDTITTGVGYDIVIGGIDADTITANSGETTATPDAGNIVIGDTGYVDWVVADGDPSDIDRIASTDPDHGGSDSITTGAGDDIVIGGEDGELVTDVIAAGITTTARTVAADTRPDHDGDTIVAGDGRNLVFGDNGDVTAAVVDGPRFGTQPITLGLVTSIESLIGGMDSITTGVGADIVIGGIDADTITANFGETPTRPDDNNIVIGDSGLIDYTAAERHTGTDRLAGDDTDPSDVDRIWSLDPDHGGNDTITTGRGDDIVIGGEDGELVVDVAISGVTTVARHVEAAATDGDTIVAGDGRNLVLGDNGQISAAAANTSRFGTQPITLGLVTSIESLIGGSDSITMGSGDDLVIGGIDADTILAGDGNNVVIGDSGLIDYTAAEHGGTLAGDDTDPSDIDRIWSLDPDHGGSDLIRTGAGDDIVIGGEDGELVVDAIIAGSTAVPRDVVTDTVRGDADDIGAGEGRNLVFGDNGQISATHADTNRFGAQPITLGLVTSIESLIGGSDSITTGGGADIIIGGIDADTILAGDGNNIVIGDSGLIDYTAAERGGTLAGDDTDPGDIDRIWSLDPDHGGNDSITTGAGDDIIIGGEDGELVGDLAIAGIVHQAPTVSAHRDALGNIVDGDTIGAGEGRNLVLGDNGQISAAAANTSRFGAQPITLGLVTSIESLIGGSDSITTGSGDDLVIGGIDADTILAGDGNNIVIGDSGLIDYTAAERGGTLAGDDTDPSDIDRIWSLDPDHGGSDLIRTGSGDDIVIGGEDGELVVDASIAGSTAVPRDVITDVVRGDGDDIVAGDGRNLVVGDNGQISAAHADTNRVGTQPITLGLVTSIESLIGGSDRITTGVGADIIIGGIDADVITANSGETAARPDGNNIVIGDAGLIDYTAAERAGTLAGDDTDPGDIDRIWTIDPDHGGNDTITTGAGDDIIIGGEDGELVSDLMIAGIVHQTPTVSADATDGDTIVAGDGRNLVFGDAGNITAAAAAGPRFGTQPITLGEVASVASLIGGSDHITAGVGADIIIGGIDADVIVANNGETATRPDGNNIVLGDSGLIDYAAAERHVGTDRLAGDDTDPSDIDRITTLDPDHGGNDTITTGAGDDIVIGGEDGELVVDAVIAGSTAIPVHVVADTTDGDIIVAGDGRNLVFGDAGDVYASATNTSRFGAQPITLGLVTSVGSLIGGSDRITTGVGADIIIGGIDADVIVANDGETATRPDGDNIVIGDSGLIDYAAAERGGTLAGDDLDPSDIDRIWTIDSDHGGNDTITTGRGNDIVIGGEDGELVVDAVIAGSTAIPVHVVPDGTDGDVINAGDGNNLVFGDAGDISASAGTTRFLGTQPITLGLVTSVGSLIGGSDRITTGVGADIIVGGIDADTIQAGDGNNIVIGDSGLIDYAAAERHVGTDRLAGDDNDPSDIDRIATLDPDHGGNDTITTGAGDDIVIGGEDGELVVDAVIAGSTAIPVHVVADTTDGDTIVAGDGRNVVFGDAGDIYASATNTSRFGAQPITLGLVTSVASLVGGSDRITTGVGADIVIGGIDADVIVANDGETATRPDAGNIVIGDSGLIDYAAAERGGTLAGDDSDPSDIDRIWTIDPDHGGNDTITTGRGDDIVIGGEDGELVVDAVIAGSTAVPVHVVADTTDGDTIVAGDGNNLVFGDAGDISASAGTTRFLGTQPISLGLVTSSDSLIGGSDSITTGSGNDIVVGGIDADTILAGDGNNIVLGDSGLIDWAAKERGGTLAGDDLDPTDIDRIWTLDPDHGGSDLIRTGTGDDIVIGGEDGELVVDASIAGSTAVSRDVITDTVRGDGDDIVAGDGNNLVFGDAGDVSASAGTTRFLGAQPISLGLVTSVGSLIGGSDRITTGVGADIVIGGIDADTILAGDGNNIVIGDSGLIDYAAAERGGALAGDDLDPTDIDRIWTLDPDHGGNDTITTGAGDDIVIGGEDGELVSDLMIAGIVHQTPTVSADTTDGDTIVAGDGRNLVFGDAGNITAAAAVGTRFGTQPITLGEVTSVGTLIGGSDSITTGTGADIVIGGVDADTILAGDGNNIVLGDSGLIDYAAAERHVGADRLAGDDTDPSDIDRILTLDAEAGGSDAITTGAGDDIVIGGEDGDLVIDAIIAGHTGVPRRVQADTVRGDGDVITAGDGRNLVFGDAGNIYAAALNTSRFGGQPITLGLVTSIASLTGGSDTITTGVGADIVIGGIDADTIVANSGETAARPDGNNIVIGDSGLIDWTAAERGGTRAGDDTDPGDIDRILTIDPDHGGSDVITTGAGDDIVIGGEDGELVSDVIVTDPAGPVLGIVPRSVAADTVRGDGDVITAGDGRNLVFGDAGEIYASAVNTSRFGTQPITLGLVTSVGSLIGGSDTITTGVGADIIIGGIDADTIVANSGETATRPDGDNIVIGDSGLIDYAAAERGGTLAGDDLDPADIDRIWTIDATDGGSDVITTGRGNDIVTGGEDGELVSDVVVTDPAGPVLGIVPRSVAADTVRGDGDVINAGDGNNLVFGDAGNITAANGTTRFLGTQPITLGEVTSVGSLIGGSDTITTGVGADIIIGGIDADTIVANFGEDVTNPSAPARPDGNDIVIGDSGVIDWAAAERHTGADRLAGDDTDPTDIDRIWTLDPDHGGNDAITTGRGDDIIIGGEDGELVSDVAIDGLVVQPFTVSAHRDALGRIVDGDVIVAGDGNNLVFGDAGNISAAAGVSRFLGTQPITLGLVTSVESLIGGSDRITTGVGADIIIGGIDADVIVANNGETAARPDGNNVVIGDSGFIDWAAAERHTGADRLAGDDTDPTDIDRIWTLDPDHGGNDTITTGAGDDIVIGGEDGELVVDASIAGSTAIARFVMADASDGDTIVAGDGRNLVFGDAGNVSASAVNTPRFGSQPITLGLVTSVESLVGGSDSITTGVGADIIIGGIDADTIVANNGETAARPDGDNIVIGDSGLIDWAAAERGGSLAGDDLDPSDIDRIWTLDADHGGSDVITTGVGNDIVIGGEDGELVVDAIIAGSTAVPRDVVADVARGDGDVITAGDGNNLVLGDAGNITAAAGFSRFLGTQPITLGEVTSVGSLIGGSDTITTGVGADIVIGGIDADTIVANNGETATRPDGNNIVIGDSGVIDWAAAERHAAGVDRAAGDDTDPTDIDRILTIDADHGGNDTITTGAGDDIVIGGEDGELVSDLVIAGLTRQAPTVSAHRDALGNIVDGDTIVAGDGRNLVFGDAGNIWASAQPGPRFGSQPITLGLVTSIESLVGGSDSITTGVGADIIIGGIDADTIVANNGETATRPDGDNIVIGDSGLIDYAAAERGGTLAGDDLDPSDVDRIWTIDPDHGGNDRITTGAGNDIVIGGEDGELVVDASIAGSTAIARFVTPDATDGDVIVAGDGNNLVFGDAGNISASAGVTRFLGTQPLTLGLVSSVGSLIGGSDRITTGVGADIIIGGVDADTIVANNGETATRPDGNDIVLGDSALIDWAARERGGALAGDDLDPSDIDRILTIDPDHGGNDTITTGRGDDIVMGGEDGELVVDAVIAGSTAIPVHVVADTTDGDTITAGDGMNLVFGDAGEIYAAAASTPATRFGTQPITLGLVTSVASLVGGSDTITTGVGRDIVIGGIDADTIVANSGETATRPDGDNIVIGDSGLIDWTAAERGGTLAGDDTNATDIDRIWSIDPDHGGNDTITTGAGDDIVVGGEDGELVVDAVIAGSTAVPVHVVADTTDGDTIVAGDGRNIVFGDNGKISAAHDDTPRFGQPNQQITLGEVTTIESLIGGSDRITTGVGADIILGGIDADIIVANSGETATRPDGNNIVIGDSGVIDWAARERGGTLAGDDNDASDIDRIWSLAPDDGGNDTITTGAGDDIIIGGEDGELVVDAIIAGNVGVPRSVIADATNGDTIVAGNGYNIVFGDSGQISAAAARAPQFGTQPITLGLVTSIAPDLGGNDSITTGRQADIVIGGTLADTINAALNETPTTPDGNNIVIGDNGFIDWTALERPYSPTLPGDDTDPSDIDRISTFAPTFGGPDVITTGAGNDFIFGGTGADILNAGAGNDLVVADHGKAEAVAGGGVNASALPLVGLSDPFTFTAIDVTPAGMGGDDVIYGGPGADILMGGQGNDTIYGGDGDDDIIGGYNVPGSYDGADRLDGGAGNDVIAGDNAIILRRGDNLNPRMRVLAGSLMYDANGNVLVTGAAQANPDSVLGRDVTVLDQSLTIQTSQTYLFGNDYIAGGPGDDAIFGGLGDDVIQGDGSIDGVQVAAYRDGGINGGGALHVTPSVPNRLTDGDDYVEGNGGNDVIFGGLGQDDLIGGSSGLFGLAGVAQRPDGADFIFGGAGTDLGYDTYGDTAIDGHAQDSDAIVGDNGNIFRLVGINGVPAATPAYLTFAYDAYTNGVSLPDRGKIIPRAIQLVDYTPGGPDFNAAAAALDAGAADELHGESGDDFIYGGKGSDVMFGESHDDDLIGGYGNDWIAAGTGDDGVIGDDGRIMTMRNGLAEPLYGLAAVATDQVIRTPGDMQRAVISPAGQLTKVVNLTPFNVDPSLAAQNPLFRPAYADDIIYGGLGNDFLHGGAGDDGISGAEALPQFYAAPINPGNALRFQQVRAEEFAAYDEFDPLRKIFVDANGLPTGNGTGTPYFLNFNAKDPAAPFADAAAGIRTDGEDKIFGDLGNDWLVGGTGKDQLFGGYGNDLLNVDDDHDSTAATADPYANNVPDTAASYEDIAYGGAGRDVLIANTGGDRLIDWVGEFNSYLVPFSPFGAATISRASNPQIQQYLYDLSKAAGADPTRAADTGADPARNGEPEGEMGLVNHSDFAWQAQTGAPDDPQPGNTQGPRDVLRSADFNNGTMQGFAVDSGSWTVSSGQMLVSAVASSGDAVAVFNIDQQLPSFYEIQATIKTIKPTATWKADSYIIFDYQSPTDFKFAGLNISLDKIQMGHRTATDWVTDVQLANVHLKADTYYNVLVSVNGLAVTVSVNGTKDFSYSFAPRIIDGLPSNLNWGLIGFGSDHARGEIDNIAVQVLTRAFTLQTTEDFADGVANLFTGYQAGTWTVTSGTGGRDYGMPVTGADRAVSLVNLGLANGLASNSHLELTATVNTWKSGGFVFDQYSPTDFKFIVLDAQADQFIVGHYRKGWVTDFTLAKVLDTGRDYTLKVSFFGSTISVTLDGAAQFGYAFNAVTVDGAFGLLSKGGLTGFDNVTIKSDDPVFATGAGGGNLLAESQTTPATGTGRLDESALAQVADAAIARLDAGDAARLGAVSFAIADLGGVQLGRTVGHTVFIDANAAGHGWFVDATPGDDAEFAALGGLDGLSAVDGRAAGRVDLLTAVSHELGHVLGIALAQTGVMRPVLETGVRRLDTDPVSPGAFGGTGLLAAVTHELGHALGIEHSEAGPALNDMAETLVTGVRRLPVSEATGSSTTASTAASTASTPTTASATSTDPALSPALAPTVSPDPNLPPGRAKK